jgi:hypothetical protein
MKIHVLWDQKRFVTLALLNTFLLFTFPNRTIKDLQTNRPKGFSNINLLELNQQWGLSYKHFDTRNLYVRPLRCVYIGAISRAILHQVCTFSNEKKYFFKCASLMGNRVQNSQV